MEAHSQSWIFLPIIVGAAIVCIFMYFIAMPSDNQDNRGPRNARPAAVTQKTLPPGLKP
jgi:hypothetical protein